MKLTLDQKTFNSNLAWVSKAIPPKPTHPILANVKIEATADAVSLTAFDLSLGIYTNFSAQVEESGTVTIPAKLLSDIVSRLPEGDIDLAVGEDMVTLSSASGRYQIPWLPADEYPQLPTVEGETIVLSSEALLDGLRGTLFATSQDETKQQITGVNLKAGADNLAFAATDGHRLAVVQTEKSADESYQNIDITLTAKALREVEKMVKNGDEVKLIFDDVQAVFECGDRRLVSRKIDATFPAYEQLIPSNFERFLTVDRKDFIGALERIAVIASQKNDIIKCDIKTEKQLITISVEANDVGSGIESIPAQISGEDCTVAFNVKYLMEGLKVLPSDEIQIKLNEPTAPVVINPLGELKMTYLVMPVQLRS